MSSSPGRSVAFGVVLLAFMGSVLLVVLDPGQVGSWAIAFVTAAVVVVMVADRRGR